MEAAAPATPLEEPTPCLADPVDPVVIIGAGPVGMRVLKLLRQASTERPFVLFGDEAYDPYNRVQLSGLLAGNHKVTDINLATDLLDDTPTNSAFVRARVVSIDRENKQVIDAAGHRTRYSKLVLATGSRPFVPALVGTDLDGVFTFRDMADAEKLAARRVHSTHTVVLGAGLLGVEAAHAMQRHNTRVTLMDHNTHPMYRQLDEQAGSLLAEELTRQGVELCLGKGLRMIMGTRGVEAVVLRDGTQLPCDTVILATGIAPNLDLAQQAGLAFGRGITVNHHMQASDSDIYAVGECSEFEKQVYGIVAPGFEQAAIAVRTILGGSDAVFRQPQLATSLKVAGISVFSLGDPQTTVGERTYVFNQGESYRRLTLSGARIVGINAIGDWRELPALREWAERGKRVSPLQLWRFRHSGNLMPDDAIAVASWPDAAVVCNCNSVCAGDLRRAIGDGAANTEALAARTCAGSTCGSCRPLLREMLGNVAPASAARGIGSLAFASIIAGVVAMVAALFSLAYPDSVQLSWRWDDLWREQRFKQISGFTILGLALGSLLFSLRKRIDRFSTGQYTWWRISHVALTVAALVALGVHTGFRMGSNLNFMLMVTFVGLALAGALLGMAIAMEHRLQPATARRLRAAGIWSHVLMAWPLPALLGAHVLKTFYF